MSPNLSLLSRSYDLRGVYGSEIDESFFENIGKALGTWGPEGKIVVGGDARLSTPSLKKALSDGLRSVGRDVIDLGIISSDMLQYATIAYAEEIALGVMVTASHNPKEYNGFKACLKNARAINLKEIGWILAKSIETASWLSPKGLGSLEQRNLLPLWIERISSFLMSDVSHLKVVADAGNGTAGVFMEALAHKLGFELIPLYFEPDGNFPNHHPSPIESKNMQDLIQKVQEVGADIGVAFDGDADRAVLCDGSGSIIGASITMAAIAELFLLENPGKTIIYNTVTSRIVPDTVAQLGGKSIREKVGHVYIKDRMSQNSDVVFAGEHSSHYFFPSLWNMDSGVIAFLLFLEYMGQFECSAQAVREKFTKYSAIEETNFRVRNVAEVLNFLSDRYKDGYQEHQDGMFVSYEDWWFSVRPSSGEPLIRVNIEATSSELLREKAEEILSQIPQFHV